MTIQAILFSKTYTNQKQKMLSDCEARTADPPGGGVGMDRVRTKHAVTPLRGPATTTRHEARQTYAAKPSTRRNGGSARPDSDTTVQYAPGAGTRPPLETDLTFGAIRGL